jgi:hypothetical protein
MRISAKYAYGKVGKKCNGKKIGWLVVLQEEFQL